MVVESLSALARAGGVALDSRGLQPDGRRRIPDLALIFISPTARAVERI
jgi:hypothetical protein